MVVDLNSIFPTSSVQFKKRAHQYVDKKTKKELCSVTTWVKSFFEDFEDTDAYKNANQFLRNKWKKSGKLACKNGTETHKQIEQFIKEAKLPTDIKAKQAVSVINRYCDPCFTTLPEMKVFNKAIGLAGTVDVVIMSNEGAIIIDWKTNKEIKQESYKDKRGQKPLEAFPDSNYYHYVLQLSTYSYILALAGIKTQHCELVHLQDDMFTSYKFLPRYDLVAQMLEEKDGFKVLGRGNKEDSK